jgi:Flp pilus assembly protein TadD
MLRRIWLTTDAPDYYPVTWTSWLMQRQLWGAAPLGYHVVNILLHGLNAVLIAQVLRRLSVPGGWFAGLIFAVHPVNVASVAWVSEHKNILAMLFFLLTVLAYLRFEDTDSPRQGTRPTTERGQWRWYAVSLVCFLLSLLAKPAAVMWPVVLLGLAWWRRGQVKGRDLVRSAPFFAASLVLGLVTVWFQSILLLGGQPARTDSFLARLACAGWAVWFYLFKAVLPVRLAMIYPRWEIDPSKPVVYLPVFLFALVLTCCWLKRRSWGRGTLAGVGYFLIMLFPVLGFFDQGFYRLSFVADQWQYLAMPGVIALVVGGATRAAQRLSAVADRCYSRMLGTVLVLILGVLTWNHSRAFLSDETLWRDTIAKNPGAWSAHYNLGTTLAGQGRTEEAIGAYRAALRVKADYPDALTNLGMLLYQQGKEAEGIAQWEAAVRCRPEHVEALNNLGAAYAKRNDLKHATLYFSLVLILRPGDAEAHSNLGTVYLGQGKLTKAVEQFETALRTDPHTTLAWQNLGVALARLGRFPEAVEAFQQVLKLDPGNSFAQAALRQLEAEGR